MTSQPSELIARLNQEEVVLEAEKAQLIQRLDRVKGDLQFIAGQRHILQQMKDAVAEPEPPTGAPEGNGKPKNRVAALQSASRKKKARKAGISS